MSVAEPYTPDDLLRLADDVDYELVDGVLVRRNMGAQSQQVAAYAFYLLSQFCFAEKQGWLFGPDGGYRCFGENSEKVRKPDVSFIRGERMSAAELPRGFLTIPPDLAVEVVSPGDLAEELDTKVSEYLAVGVRLVWVLYPLTQRVYVHHEGGGTILKPVDPIDGGEVLPGFSCRVGEFFQPPPGVRAS